MVRRIVTGHQGGKASAIADGEPARTDIFSATPGMATSYIWATSAMPQIPDEGVVETFGDSLPFLPGVGETRFLYLQVPPDSVAGGESFDPAAAWTEMAAKQPDFMALMDAENPGMHRTETCDYVILLDGEIHLELDDGEVVELRRHDVVVQNGTRHAWRNPGERPALLAVVMIGASRR